ncbi:UNVERIFIED_CONTAM: holin [Salmonella enterica subsp. enterica serovar Weltevreden]
MSARERAGRTAAQSAVGILTVDATGLLDIDWAGVASVVGLAAIVSVLTSIAGSQVGTAGDPSLVKPLEVGDEPPTSRFADVVDPDNFQEGDPEGERVLEEDETPPPEGYEPRH